MPLPSSQRDPVKTDVKSCLSLRAPTFRRGKVHTICAPCLSGLLACVSPQTSLYSCHTISLPVPTQARHSPAPGPLRVLFPMLGCYPAGALLGSFTSFGSLPKSLKDAVPDHPVSHSIPFTLRFSLLAFYCPRYDIFVYCQPPPLGGKFQEGFWWLCVLLCLRPQDIAHTQ